MWKKDDDQPHRPTPGPTAAPAVGPAASPTQVRKAGFATIGPSIVIKGEVTGGEDLLIQGQVDGSVTLGLHSVTIGDGGRVKAGITGRVITVEGAVEGDLSAEEQIVLRGTARVKGDLSAPRVVLEDGATFRGLVDMGSAPELDAPKAREPAAPEARSQPAATARADAKPVPAEGQDKVKEKEKDGETQRRPSEGGKSATG